MPWQPLPHIAFAVATFPFAASTPEDLVLEIGDELYIIEETPDGNWLRGYLLKPPSLLAGLTSVKGQTLEARVFSGIFPRSCVEVRELLGESEADDDDDDDDDDDGSSEGQNIEGGGGGDASDDGAAASRDGAVQQGSDSAKSGIAGRQHKKKAAQNGRAGTNGTGTGAVSKHLSRTRSAATISAHERLSVPVKRDPNAPRPQAPVPMLKIGDETPTSAAEPLIDEIASCLREWHSTNLHELLLSRQYHKLDVLSQLITSLTQARQQFLHNVLTTWEYTKLREKTVWDLVRVNKLCGGEVIVRDPAQRGRILTGDDSVIEITQLQSVMSMLSEPPQQPAEHSIPHHLLVDVKGFAGASTEGTTLVLSLVGLVGGSLVRLSENYSIASPPGGSINNLTRGLSMRTLFTDLSSGDIGEAPTLDSELFLVVSVRSSQKILVSSHPGSKPQSRSGLGSAGHGANGNSLPNTAGSKEHSRPPLSSGNKAGRRSLMWSGKTTRSQFSRSGTATAKLDALNENGDDAGHADNASRDGPPSSATSRSGTRDSVDGGADHYIAVDRMTGVGVLKLNAIMKQQNDEVEHVINIWAPTDRHGSVTSERTGDDWHPIIQDLMTSKSGQFDKSRGAERVQVHLRAFDHQDADTLIKATPTLLAGIHKTNKMGFTGAPTKPRSDIYVTIHDAALTRPVLLSRYGTSPTSLPSGLHGNNLQVTLEVRRATGERIDNCIYPYSNGKAMSTWHSLATEKGDAWRQTLRLSLAPQDVSSAHIAMFVADMPNPPFAVAYMPLWDQDAFVADGKHPLLLYRIDENTVAPRPPAGSPPNRGGYFSLPWSTKGRGDAQAEVTGPLATLRVESYLCSTRFSQDRVVLGLIGWRDGPREAIPKLLQQLIFVPEIEIVKLLSDVLDALFGVLVEYAGNDEYEDLVFKALVRVLDIVHDRRFNVGPLVDYYAENKFNYPFATPCLVRSFTRLLAKPTEPEIARKLRATFKVVRHILKFITHARDQQKVKEAGIGITSTTPGFTRHLQTIFKSLENMMRNTAPVLVGSQTLAVQHFHTWLPELSNLLTTEEILHIAIDFMDACANVKGKLVLYKLGLIINYSRLDIFSHPEQRAALSTNTARWIAPHWGMVATVTDQWKEQVRLCCSILASQIDHLGAEIPDYIPKILESYIAIQQSIEAAAAAAAAAPSTTTTNKASPPAKPGRTRLSLLFPTQYPFPSRPIASLESGMEEAVDGRSQQSTELQKQQQQQQQQQKEQPAFDEALVELSAVLSALSNSHSGMQLELADGDLATILENTLRVHMSILRGEAFPSTWLSTQIFHHKSTMRTLQYLATILLDSFLPDPDDAEGFNTELWKMFFSTLLMLVSSPCLALETFPEQKRRAVWKIAGDVREHGADLLRRTWEAIGWEATADERQRYGLNRMGGYQVQYVPTLVGPIVELCLSVHEGLRRVAVEVLQTMIVSEWTLSEDLSVIQAEIIDYLDHYFKTKPLTESILQKLFVGELLDRFTGLADEPDEQLYAALLELVGTIDEFLDLLVAVHGGDGGGAVGGGGAGGSPGRSTANVCASGEASSLIDRLRLMEFLRDMHKEEMFVRYVHQLATLQAASRNHAEAGLALRLHADLYDWDPLRTASALSEPAFPAQSHFERKERIYFDMIKQFEEGAAWSSALAAYKELQVQYETNTYDFAKLARTERAIATVHETIAKNDRLVPKYFRVVFRGLGFPAPIRDKEYVYEGSPHERTSAFTDRMQEHYPAAQILVVPAGSGAAQSRLHGASGEGGDNSGGQSTEEMIDDIVEGQFLVVSAISPHRDLTHNVFQRARVPQAIRDYLVSSHPQTFSVSVQRRTSGPVAEHYVDKIMYTTAEAFPTILRRSEIVAVGEVRLSAKEAALERILRKTAEMTVVEKRIADGDTSTETAQLLLDAISVSVNPGSENSVVCYRELLPRGGKGSNVSNGSDGSDGSRDGSDDDSDRQSDDDDDDDDTPELDAQENAIKMALVDHAMMIKRSLGLLAKMTNAQLASHAEDLLQYFEATFAPEIAIFTPPTALAAAPAAPTWPRTTSALDTASPTQPDGTATATADHNHNNSASVSGIASPVTNGGAAEEAGVRQSTQRPARSTRLSFAAGGSGSGSGIGMSILGGHRKRESSFAQNGEATVAGSRRSSNAAGDGHTAKSEHGGGSSTTNRNSYFWGMNNDLPPLPSHGGSGADTAHSGSHRARNGDLPVLSPNGLDPAAMGDNVSPLARHSVMGNTTSASANRRARSSSGGGGGVGNVLGGNGNNNGNRMSKAMANGTADGGGMRKSADVLSPEQKKRMTTDGLAGDNGHAKAGGNGGNGGGIVKMGSVRKRLNMLKLGKKSAKSENVMVAVDEE